LTSAYIWLNYHQATGQIRPGHSQLGGYRVVNFLDLVPYLPPTPYVHVGTQITVDSGGPVQVGWRHRLPAYQQGLSALISAQK
jgi:hypothetical protein